MSFKLYPNNNYNSSDNSILDCITNYKSIAQEFCNQYYSIYDQNYRNLKKFYSSNCLITLQDNEFMGFDNFVKCLENHNINKIIHHGMNVQSQPINTQALLVTINGVVSLLTDNSNNNSINKFTETIILQRNKQNQIFITNQVLKLTDLLN